jgi:ribosomal protein S27AE
MTDRARKSLKLVRGPSMGHSKPAQPVLVIASVHPVDLTCGKCGTVLLHGTVLVLHVDGLLIQCGECGSYNSTD